MLLMSACICGTCRTPRRCNREVEATGSGSSSSSRRKGGRSRRQQDSASSSAAGEIVLSCRDTVEDFWVGLVVNLGSVAQCYSCRLQVLGSDAARVTPWSPRASQNPVSIMLLHSSHAAAPSIALLCPLLPQLAWCHPLPSPSRRPRFHPRGRLVVATASCTVAR